MSPILCSGDVGECLARHLPSRFCTRITRNQVVKGIRVLATIYKSFEGEEINKFRKTQKGGVEIVLKIIFTLTNAHAN